MNSHKNKTIDISADEYAALIGACITADSPMSPEACIDKTVCGDAFDVLGFLPRGFFDLLIADPPYNLDKTFDGEKFRKTAVKVSEQDIREFYEQALREEPKKLINCLVKEIVLFDDRMEICFNSPIKKSPDESAVPIGIFKNIKFYRIALSNDVRNPSVQYPWDFSFSHSKVFILGQKRI